MCVGRGIIILGCNLIFAEEERFPREVCVEREEPKKTLGGASIGERLPNAMLYLYRICLVLRGAIVNRTKYC